jgi:hypothetical protein
MKPAPGQRLLAVAVGKQSEVTDLDEAGGQDMEQETADELDCIKLHDAAAVVVPRIPPSEAHLTVIEAEESSVGDGKLNSFAQRLGYFTIGWKDTKSTQGWQQLALAPRARMWIKREQK